MVVNLIKLEEIKSRIKKQEDSLKKFDEKTKEIREKIVNKKRGLEEINKKINKFFSFIFLSTILGKLFPIFLK